MNSAKLLGRWSYTDECTEVAHGTVLAFSKSAEKNNVSACFLMEDEAINAVMECTLTTQSIVIEEIGDAISNRYEGVISDDGSSITGKWLCTKSSMTGTNEGDSGTFKLIKSASEEPSAAQRFHGKWLYTDDFSAAEDGTLLEFTATDDGDLSAFFVLEEGEVPNPSQCILGKDGKGVTIHEISESISNDYVGTMDSSGNTITGTWTCIKSADEDNVAVGDSGQFALTKA